MWYLDIFTGNITHINKIKYYFHNSTHTHNKYTLLLSSSCFPCSTTHSPPNFISSLLFLTGHLGISNHALVHVHLLVFPSLLPSPMTPPKKTKSILFCPYIHWSLVKLLVASLLREYKSFSICITARSHPLKRAILWDGEGLGHLS